MIRELPSTAKVDGGTHYRLRRQTQHYDNDGNLQEIQHELVIGTTDGGFTPRTMTATQEAIIRDTTAFQNDSFNGNAPDTKGKPVDQIAEAGLDYVEANDRFPWT